MRHTLKSLLIITKSGEPKALELGQAVAQWLNNRGVTCHLQEKTRGLTQIGEGLDLNLVLVLGGDGTMLSVARKLSNLQLPLLGINLGKVGFLAELTTDNWAEHLDTILKGGFTVEERIALTYEVERFGAPLAQGRVINDIVVNRGQLARLIDMELTVGGEFLAHIRADGVIAATPTGSTAYCVSAGGPLLFPRLQAYSLTAICPFMSGFKPLVLPANVETVISIPNNRAELFLTLDGQDGMELFEGDRIRINQAPEGFRCVRFPDSAYVDKLRAKGLTVNHIKHPCPEKDGG